MNIFTTPMNVGSSGGANNAPKPSGGATSPVSNLMGVFGQTWGSPTTNPASSLNANNLWNVFGGVGAFGGQGASALSGGVLGGGAPSPGAFGGQSPWSSIFANSPLLRRFQGFADGGPVADAPPANTFRILHYLLGGRV